MATRQRKNRGKDLDDVNVGGGDSRPKIGELIQVYSFPDGKWVRMRLHGPVYTTGGYWVAVKKKDGSKGAFYTPAVSYDPDTQTLDSTISDPFRDAQGILNSEDNQIIRFSKKGYINGIIRSEQKNLPSKIRPTKEEAKTGFKDRDSDTPTPNKAVPLTPGLLKKIKALKELNTVEGKKATKAYAVTDPEFGCDIMIKYDSKASGANMYEVQISTQKPMSDEEKGYLLQNLELIEEAESVSEDEARTDLEGWAERNGYAEALGLKGKKKKGKKSKDVDSDDDDFDDDDDDDDDEDVKPSKKGKGSSKKSKTVDNDEDGEDDDDDFDDDDVEEEDVKTKSKKKSKKSATKKKSKIIDEDDEDDDFDDDDDDEEIPSKKKVKSKSKKSKTVDNGDGDEDEDEDEDEEKPSKKSKSKTKSKSKKAKPVDEDDDDLDDDDIPF